MFEKIKKAVSVKSVPSEIAQFFKELRKENSALADILATYVAYGKDPMELMNLSPGMQGDFNFFAGNTWGYWFAALQPLANKPGKLTLEQWLRLGQVFMLKPVFADNKKQKVSTAPPWFVELQGRRQLTCEDSALYRSVWNLSSLHPLLVAAGIENNHVPRVIVEAFLLNLNGRHYDWDKPIRVFTKIEEVHARPLVALINRESSIIPEIMALADAPTKVGVSTWLTLFPELLPPLSPMISDWACDSAKTVRKAAIGLIGLMRNEQRDFALKTALEKGSASRLDNVISYAGLLGSEGRTLLEEVLARGEGGKRDEMISVALRQSEAVAEMPQAELSVLPAPPLNTTPLDETYVTQLEEVAAKWTASLAKNEDKWAKNSLRAVSQLSRTDYRAVVDWLNGTRSKPAAVKALHHLLLSNTKLPLLPALRVAVELTSHRNKSGVQELNFYYLDNILGRDYDLRSLLQAAQLLGVGDAVNQIAQSAFRWQGLAGRNPEHIWPFFVEHPVRLDEALGLRQKTKQQNYYWGPDELGVAIAILEMYPVLPTQYIPLLAQMATSERKSNRKQAQELLEARQSVLPIATQALSDSKSEIRATAAAWIGRIANTDGIEPLQKALAKEKQEKAQAAMLNALHRLGDDISAYLTPEVLQAAATKGLSAKIPAAMDWVPLEALPGCRFADGSQVDPSILRWWAILAVKLKDPQGAGLIPLYVSLLDKDSRETLGRFILDLWIAYDTTGPTDEECRAHASVNVDARHKQYQHWRKKFPEIYPALAAMTREQVYEELRREMSKVYLKSAIAVKGLLALSTGAPGYYVVSATERYIKDHGSRRSQVEALVTAAAVNDDPAAIQLVLSVARKFKQESVRAKAGELAEDIADRKGWSLDELADRTIPTAGFDEDGLLTLDYGQRCFTGRISRSEKTGDFSISVFNSDGKAISSLPKPNMGDDEELAAEARKQLTTSKKELKQVVAGQTARLFEAMCLERSWEKDAWTEYLASHPIMRHLISTLVWKAQDEENGSYRLFIPTADKELLNINDDDTQLLEHERISLAHHVVICGQESEEWQKHLADYQIKQLFGQFGTNVPEVKDSATEVDDHLGWLSDTFAIRGRALKRGFQRGQAEDGGWFNQYFKLLPSANLRVAIEFTGSVLPEEQIPATVERLVFQRNWSNIKLSEVPPVLLAESYADYVYIAEAGSFDPDWRTKSGF